MAVTLTVLDPREPFTLNAQVIDLSGSGMLVSVPSPIPCGAPVKVEGNDMLLLGEVCRCDAGRHQYRVALEIHHSLAALSELERMNRAILGEPARRPATSSRR